MSSREYVIARYEFKGHRFEILVKPEEALRFKSGEKISIDDVLIGDFVYKDARKGLKASPESLMKVFGTDDVRKVASEILKKGEIQLTAEQRRRLVEQKKKQIISFISRNAIDPRTGLPIPPARIETAMAEARVGVDPFKGVEEQALAIIKAISRILPIRIARAVLRISIPATYAGRAYSQLMRLGELKNANWKSDGSLEAELEIPAGMQTEVIEKINRLTNGTAKIESRVFK